jgi:hypothetical protein
VPYSDKPTENTLTQLVDTLGIHTGQFPSGNVMLSPRMGFNWDPFGNGNTILRGGVGLFTGRPPYVWMSNAFTGTGLEQATLTCTPGSIPAFTTDIASLPTACAGGGTANAPPAGVVYFDKDFKFQQRSNTRLASITACPEGWWRRSIFCAPKPAIRCTRPTTTSSSGR